MKAAATSKEEDAPKVRNYADEMQKVIQVAVATRKTYTATGLAHEITKRLRRTDPELLHGWLELQAEEVLREHISRQSRSQRAHNRAVTGRADFGDAVKKYAETGDENTLTSWLDCTYTVDENHTKMTLSDMGEDELNFAATYHQKLADTNAFEARFLSALADKVGTGTVGDHFTETQVAEMRLGLSKLFGSKKR